MDECFAVFIYIKHLIFKIAENTYLCRLKKDSTFKVT